MTRTLTIPPALHEVLGESQAPAHVALVVLAGLAGGVGFGAHLRHAHVGAAAGVVATLLVADIAAGCVANFTPGTSAFYATRPRHRALFLAVHAHLPVVAWLMGWALGPTLVVWALTILGGVVTTFLPAGGTQRVVGGALLALTLVVSALVPGLPEVARAVAVLFVLKVLFAFAVDHDGVGRTARS